MEGDIKATAKFVSKKISKIRWRPTSRHIVQKATIFASGSWDDEENELSIWHLQDGTPSIADDDDTSTQTVDGEPTLIGSAAHHGDVSDLLFLEQDNIVTASSCGSVFVYKYDQRSQSVSLRHTFPKVHHYTEHSLRNCPCTAVASRGDEVIASVGEDGRLNLMTLETARTAPALTRTIETANSCSLNAVCFLTQTEVAAVNSVGQFKIWDVRQASNDPVRVFVLTGERVPLHCIDRHPAQPHIVATGGSDGTLSLWDMRQDKYPITLLSAHSSDMWEVRFHPSHPAHLFTCSNDGSLWHWDSSDTRMPSLNSMHSRGEGLSLLNANAMATSSAADANASSVNSWLMGDAAKRHLEVKHLLPGNIFSVNSLDVSESTVLCGTDGEQICVVRGLAIC